MKNKNTQKKQASKVKTVEDVLIDATQGYRVAKRLHLDDYKRQGEGTIANVRKMQVGLSNERKQGQNVILTSSDLGYGFAWGFAHDKRTIQIGNLVYRFAEKNVVATFKTFAEFVQYVSRKGELNVKGCEKWKALSNGGRYCLYTDGKTVLRLEQAGKASGNYADFQKGGSHYGKFSTFGKVKISK